MQNITIQLSVKDAEFLRQSLLRAGVRLVRATKRDHEVLTEYGAADADPSVQSMFLAAKSSGVVALDLSSVLSQILKSGKPVALVSVKDGAPKVDELRDHLRAGLGAPAKDRREPAPAPDSDRRETIIRELINAGYSEATAVAYLEQSEQEAQS